MSGAVLWVVDGEQDKPTRGPVDAPSEATIPHAAIARPRPRQPATSRRVVPVSPEQLPEPEWRDAPVATLAPTPAAETPPSSLPPVRTLDPPLPRHRLRSAILLVALVVAAGALLAAVIGFIVASLAFALRAAVTS